MVPSTPRSLGKFAVRLASVRTGWESSTPTRDQVPEETYAKFFSLAGTAATAEAVSCEPTATTFVAAGRPVRSAMAGSSVPTVSPGCTSGGNSPPGRAPPGREPPAPFPAPAAERPGGGGVGGPGGGRAGRR